MPKLCFPTCQISQRSNSSPTLFPWSPLCTSEGSAQWQSSPTSPTSLKKSCKNSLKMELETLEDIFDFLSDKYHCCGEHKSGRQSFEIHQQSQLFFPVFFFKCWTAQTSFPDRRNIVADRRLSQYFDYPNIFVPCLELAAGAVLVTSPCLAAGTRSWKMWEWGWICPDSTAWLIQRDTGKPFQVNSPSSSLAKLTLAGKICSSLGITADKRMFKAQSRAEHFNFPPGDPIFLCAVTPTRWTRI